MGQTRIKTIGADLEEIEKESKSTEEVGVSKKKKKKISKLPKGRIYINARFNNTLVCLTDDKGNVICWSSAGNAGLKNTKEGTPYAGTRAMETLLEKMKNIEIGELEVYVKGVGPGREPALRVLFSKDYNITLIKDITPIPFGGPTKPKPRRV